MKKKIENHITVLATCSHIITISKFVGQIPNAVGKTTIANHLISKINSIVLLTIYTAMVSIYILDWGIISIQLSAQVRKAKTVVGMLIMLIFVGFTPFRKTNFTALVSMIQEIDEELKVMNVGLDYVETRKKINRFFYGFLATGFAYLGADLSMRHVACHIGSIGEWANAMTVITQMVCEAQIVALVWLLADRFQILNDYLYNFHASKRSASEICWVTPVGAKSTRLSVLSRIHDKLCVICRKVENVFAAHLALITTQCFVAVTLKVYNLFSTIIRFNSRCFSLFATLSIVFDLLHVFLIVVFTSAASNKVNRIVQVSHIIYYN